MKYRLVFIFAFVAQCSMGQELNVFPIYNIGHEDGTPFLFLNASEHFRWSEHPDSNLIDEEYEHAIHQSRSMDVNLHTLSDSNRSLFFELSTISKTDSVFIYQSGSNSVQAFPIANAPMVAVLSPYAYEPPFSVYDYQFGFRLPHIQFAKNQFVAASIGTKNPFVTNGLVPMRWQEVPNLEIPPVDMSPTESEVLKTYWFQNQNYSFYLQDIANAYNLTTRKLIIKQIESDTWICEHLFQEGESAFLNPIALEGDSTFEVGVQWTGMLFKNKPPIIFGFQDESFGCPVIEFIAPHMHGIVVSCDNRH